MQVFLERGSSSAEGNFRRELIGPGHPKQQLGGINASILEGRPFGAAWRSLRYCSKQDSTRDVSNSDVAFSILLNLSTV